MRVEDYPAIRKQQTFFVSRWITRQIQEEYFGFVGDIPRVAAKCGAKVAAAQCIDVVNSSEALELQEQHNALTSHDVVAAVARARKKRLTTLSKPAKHLELGEVGTYKLGGNLNAIGAKITDDQGLIAHDRRSLAWRFSRLAGELVELDEVEEPYLTLGIFYDRHADRVQDTLDFVARSTPDFVDVYEARAHQATVTLF